MKKSDRGPLLVQPPGATCPMPIGRDTDISQLAEQHLSTVAEDLYSGDNPKFEGKTRLEVAVLSLAEESAYDPAARTEFLNRIMGKPRQKIDTTSVNINLSDFLGQLAKEDSGQFAGEVVDVAPSEPADDGGMFE